MSGRTIRLFVLAGFLSVLAVVPIGAQFSTKPPSSAAPDVKIQTSDKPPAVWYRGLDGIVVSQTIADGELKLDLTLNCNGTLVSLKMIAEYAQTKDGLIHGAITAVDWEIKPTGATMPLDLNDPELIDTLHALVDCPFTFRPHLTSAGLMVSNIKLGADETSCKIAKLFGGMYTRSKDGTIPTPKSEMKVDKTPAIGGMTLSSPRYLDHYPQYFPPDPAHPLPRELGSMEDPQGVARRAAVPVMPPPDPPGEVKSPALDGAVKPAGYSTPATPPMMPPPEPPGEVKSVPLEEVKPKDADIRPLAPAPHLKPASECVQPTAEPGLVLRSKPMTLAQP